MWAYTMAENVLGLPRQDTVAMSVRQGLDCDSALKLRASGCYSVIGIVSGVSVCLKLIAHIPGLRPIRDSRGHACPGAPSQQGGCPEGTVKAGHCRRGDPHELLNCHAICQVTLHRPAF